MKHEKSCGAVVVNRSHGKPKVLLIQHQNGGHWAFAKGHVEARETETETALREIREETGLGVTLDTGFRSVTTYCPNEETTKDVVYFIAMTEDTALVPQVEEVIGADWFTGQEAMTLITYENDRKLLQSALAYLKDQQYI